MGKFAAVYDLPGGEQMLVCVVNPTGQEPHFQVSTEIHGIQTAMDMPVQLNIAPETEKMTHAEQKKLAVDYLEQMPMENLLQLRRMMVIELKKQQSPEYLRKNATEN